MLREIATIVATIKLDVLNKFICLETERNHRPLNIGIPNLFSTWIRTIVIMKIILVLYNFFASVGTIL